MSGPDAYWESLLAEVTTRPLAAEVDPSPIRSTDFADGYGVRLTSVGDYRLFAHYSVPHGTGPFPAIVHAPGYASVVGVPSWEERRDHAALAICARGQRLSDRPFAAAFPGLLTTEIEDPRRWPLRAWVADSLRGLDFLLEREEIDRRRIVVTGGDMALFTAALRAEVRACVVSDPFLYNVVRVARRITSYPQEEINDYLRAYPTARERVEATLEVADPRHVAHRVTCDVLLSCGPAGSYFDRAAADELAAAIGSRATVLERTGRGYLDRLAVEKWLRERTIAP